MYSKRAYNVMEKIFPGAVWSIPADDKSIYITFDDGPIPHITPWVLDTLNKYDAKATFFCLGKNVKENPEIYQRILAEGHVAGNHTQNHLNGWRTRKETYMADVNECSKWVDSKLFRPPYGLLRRGHYKMLNQDYTVVMWNILSGDFDKNFSAEKCVDNVISKAKPGDIVLFHDSVKAWDRLHYALPQVLNYYTERNISFRAIGGQF